MAIGYPGIKDHINCLIVSLVNKKKGGIFGVGVLHRLTGSTVVRTSIIFVYLIVSFSHSE